MKNTVGILAVLTCVIVLSSFSKNPKKDNFIKTVEKGFVQIQKGFSNSVSKPSKCNSIYASTTEVTNREYREFLNSIKEKGEDTNLYIYDSVQWTTFYPTGNLKSIENKYHWHPAYDNYPAVNILFEGAQKYCEWLTDKYNNHPQKKYKKVLFRLPSEKEWKRAANPLPGGELPWYGRYPYNTEGKNLTNIKVDGDYTFDGALCTSIVANYPANRLGIYDIIGNVSEMTNSKGIAKGGSWHSLIDDCFIDKTQSYEKANPEVGFRVFMEIIES